MGTLSENCGSVHKDLGQSYQQKVWFSICNTNQTTNIYTRYKVQYTGQGLTWTQQPVS